MSDPIRNHFHFTNNIVQLVLSDVSEEQARVRSRGEDGPSIIWTVGHLLDYRVRLLNTIGIEKSSPWKEKFGDGSATDGSDYPPLTEMATAWNELGDHQLAATAAEDAIQLDPLRETAHWLLIEAELARGDRAAALGAFGRCEDTLASEFGASPSSETTAIIESAI